MYQSLGKHSDLIILLSELRTLYFLDKAALQQLDRYDGGSRYHTLKEKQRAAYLNKNWDEADRIEALIHQEYDLLDEIGMPKPK